MLAPGYDNVYVLGCFARYATIYSQQVRSINLVDSLCRNGQLAKGTRVAVVGGSTAGLTAAVAAALRGASVQVFEKESVLFPIQRNPGPRFLHPHVYDWPLGELQGGAAKLPVMTWQAADASVVFKDLEAAWNNARAQLGIDPVQTNSELVNVRTKDRKPVLTFAGKGDVEVDVALLAIGFGAEIDRADLQRYWQSDPNDANLAGSTVLISGAGDGALTDVMRLCIQDFRHDEIVASFAGQDSIIGSFKELLQGKDNAQIEQVFASVKAKTRFAFGPKIAFRQGISVILNAPEDYLESTSSALLNRFIVYLLEKETKFTREGGALQYPIPALSTLGEKPQFEVELCLNGKPRKIKCDRLIVRHGPEKHADMPKHWAKLLPIWEACAPLREKWKAKLQATDRTLIPMYSPADYNLSAPRHVVRAQRTAADSSVKLRCFVVESSSFGNDPIGGSFKDLLETHAETLGRALQTNLAPSEIHTKSKNINDALLDGSAFGETVAALQSADVAIMDVTRFEPGVMLLLGIRSVLRQGVTLITTLEKFDTHNWSRLPFNLKELYPLYIKPETDNLNSSSHPFQWLGVTIANALAEYRALPQYQDSPAHENVRRLGPSATYFGRIRAESGILWLCPFASQYMQTLGGSKVPVAIKKAFGLKTPFERITDIVSPQLVSQRLYTAVRRRDLCVVDWTTWSANVFFELGVRLAVNRFATVSIIAGLIDAPNSEEKAPLESDIEQRRRLLKLLGPIEYSLPGAQQLDGIKERHRQMIDHAASPGPVPPTWGDIPFDYVYRLIADLTVPALAASREEVEQLLLSQAGMRTGTGGTTDFSSPVLYGDTSQAIKEDAEATAREMLLAAWFYLSERTGLKQIEVARLGDSAYRAQLKKYLELGDRIIGLLELSKSEHDVETGTGIKNTVDAHRTAIRNRGGKSNVGPQ